jgi:hypothetical protein
MGYTLKKIEISFKNGQVEQFEPFYKQVYRNNAEGYISFECKKQDVHDVAPDKIVIELINVNYIKYIY